LTNRYTLFAEKNLNFDQKLEKKGKCQ